MAFFRKKPVVVEARRLEDTEASFLEMEDWVGEWGYARKDLFGKQDFQLRTLEGWLTVHPGDWIIRGVEDEFYPCAGSIFDKTYEEVCEG